MNSQQPVDCQNKSHVLRIQSHGYEHYDQCEEAGLGYPSSSNAGKRGSDATVMGNTAVIGIMSLYKHGGLSRMHPLHGMHPLHYTASALLYRTRKDVCEHCNV